MLPFTTTDAVTVLKKSANLNAALKNFLKRELRNGDPAVRFVKDMRELVDSPNTTRFENYIERSRSKFETELVGIGGHAHMELVASIANKVTEKYAEDFNATYNITDEKVEVTDKKKFDEIVKSALSIVDEDLKGAGFEDSPFLKNAVFLTIFDRRVLDIVLAKGN